MRMQTHPASTNKILNQTMTQQGGIKTQLNSHLAFNAHSDSVVEPAAHRRTALRPVALPVVYVPAAVALHTLGSDAPVTVLVEKACGHDVLQHSKCMGERREAGMKSTQPGTEKNNVRAYL